MPHTHPPIIIKKVQPEDIKFIKKIEMECSLSEWSSQDYILETSHQNSVFLTALENHKKVGFILARLIPNTEHSYKGGTAEIYNIAVRDKSRRKGIGIKLLK